MILCLVQHGKAADKKVDLDRPLTEEGAREVESVGAFLSGKDLGPVAVWHSGKTRARQTAELLARHVAPRAALEARDGLAPKDDVGNVIEELREREEDLMIVGHLPFLSKLAAALVAGNKDAGVVAFKNAGVVCLERDAENAWHVAWAVTPDLLAAHAPA